MSRPAGARREVREGPGGELVLVATPIGNLEDLSPRAVSALASADVIVCEDTRRTRKLLTHAGVGHKDLVAVHDHNEASQVRVILRELDRGRRVVVVTDAGTPGISDPGGRLVAGAAAAGVVVSVVPGPSAAVSALVVSGLPTGRFVFEGFLPRRGAERSRRLATIASERRTTVVYEAPHRLAATLGDLERSCGSLRQVAVARELTKLHEEVWRGSLGAAAERARASEPRGEHVIVLAGSPDPAPPGPEVLEEAVSERLRSGLSPSEAAGEVARELGVTRRSVYEVAVGIRSRERRS